MLQYNFDTSEYQQPSSARYVSDWDGCADLSPAFFKNEVSYFSDEKKLYLYTACFPPQFTRKTAQALEYYRQYVSFLQAEFLELIEFCLD